MLSRRDRPPMYAPGKEGSDDAERTACFEKTTLRQAVCWEQVSDTEHQEGHVESEEERKESNGRSQRAYQQDKGEDEPALRPCQPDDYAGTVDSAHHEIKAKHRWQENRYNWEDNESRQRFGPLSLPAFKSYPC